MAYTKKQATTEQNVIDEVSSVGTSTSKTTIKKEKKKFSPDDMIPCVSITPGEMFFIGGKTKDLYTFADIDDTVDIPFKDLDYSARSKDAMMYKPRFIIQDKDFVALHKSLDELYSSLYSIKDLKSIIKMDIRKMENVIKSLPVGAQESLKTLASTMIDNGSLDSIQKVKKLDSIFDTEMLTRLLSK